MDQSNWLIAKIKITIGLPRHPQLINMIQNTVIPFQVRNKLNYFLIRQFLKIFIVSYDEFYKKLMQMTKFEPSTVRNFQQYLNDHLTN